MSEISRLETSTVESTFEIALQELEEQGLAPMASTDNVVFRRLV